MIAGFGFVLPGPNEACSIRRQPEKVVSEQARTVGDWAEHSSARVQRPKQAIVAIGLYDDAGVRLISGAVDRGARAFASGSAAAKSEERFWRPTGLDAEELTEWRRRAIDDPMEEHRIPS